LDDSTIFDIQMIFEG